MSLRPIHAAICVVGLLWACSSENSLKDELEPDVGAGQDTDDPGQGADTDTDDWIPGQDTPPETADTGWVFPPDTGTGSGTGTGTGTGSGTGTGGTGTGSTGTGTGTGTIDTGLTDDEICQNAAALAGYLDPYQTAGDGRVLYCHSSSGSNFVLVESDISSCLPHLNHNFDVFPTTGCDS